MKNKSKTTQQRRILEYQDFDLRKFKVTEEGVDVIHYESGKDGGEITKKGKAQPHPDLTDKLEELKFYMAARLGLLEGWDFAREAIKKDPGLLEEAIEKHKDAIGRCHVNGFTYVGSGDTEGVQITGSIKLPHYGSVGLAVAKIKFSGIELGYEEEVEILCEAIKKEVYAYRFQSKKLQADIESEIEKEEDPELFWFPEDKDPSLN